MEENKAVVEENMSTRPTKKKKAIANMQFPKEAFIRNLNPFLLKKAPYSVELGYSLEGPFEKIKEFYSRYEAHTFAAKHNRASLGKSDVQEIKD